MSKVLPAMLLVLVFQQSTSLGDSLGPKKYLILEAKKKQTPEDQAQAEFRARKLLQRLDKQIRESHKRIEEIKRLQESRRIESEKRLQELKKNV
jgi:TolA-binding protein